MGWTEFRFGATPEAIDWVSTLLATAHSTSELRISSHSESAVWPFTVSLYLPDSLSPHAELEKLAQLVSPLQRTGLISAAEIGSVETIAASHPALHRVGQRFVVLSPEATYQPQAHEIVLRLGNTQAFGSGLHPATMLSLQLLERQVTPTMQALDLGCGSGILSIAMAKLGAEVVAIDNDQHAVEAAQAAVCGNGVEQQVTVRAGSLGSGAHLGHWMNGTAIEAPSLQPAAEFDLIAANILGRVHLALVDDYRRALRPPDSQNPQGGLIITAGFTIDQEEDITTALATAGFEAVDQARSGEWLAFAHRLRQSQA